MRFLLPIDNEVYRELKSWVRDNWDKRVPQKDRPYKIARMFYSGHELEHLRISETMAGRDFDAHAFLLTRVNNHYNYVADSIVILNNEKDYVYECSAEMYPPQEEFIARYELLDGYYSKLISRAMEYFSERGIYYGNVYISGGYVMQFDRRPTGMNEWEAANDRIIMSESAYNEDLKQIKKEFDSERNAA